MSETLEIPDGWFVCGVDLDAEVPWCRIAHPEMGSDAERILHIHPALAYYLRRHFCGSKEMQKMIEENTRRGIANAIKKALGLNEE